ncbi:MAG: hypothetical protein J7494_01795 [Sphingobium sp.]|nr:hypothetical protein [Sphingobium sp.]
MKHLLISFVLMISIWGVTLAMPQSGLHWLLLIGSILATIDFARALWGYARARLEPEEAEPSPGD